MKEEGTDFSLAISMPGMLRLVGVFALFFTVIVQHLQPALPGQPALVIPITPMAKSLKCLRLIELSLNAAFNF